MCVLLSIPRNNSDIVIYFDYIALSLVIWNMLNPSYLRQNPNGQWTNLSGTG